MVIYKNPGSYITETGALPLSVTEVETAVPAFIGHTEKAQRNSPGDLSSVPTRIASIGDYETLFGGPAPASNNGGYLLYYSLKLFYANGGGECYIVSVGDYAAGIEKGNETTGLLGGLAKLASLDGPTIIIIPDSVSLGSSREHYEVFEAALEQCSEREDRMAIVDIYIEENKDNCLVLRDLLTDDVRKLKYGAAYYPWLETTFISSGHNLALPPSGAIAGVYAQVDSSRGVWKAPANVSLKAVSGLTHNLSSDEQAGLEVDPVTGKSINAIRSFSGRGILVWGARTLAGNDNEWRYVPVRRFFSMVEQSLKASTAWAVYEPNEASTWAKIKAMIQTYLTEKWRDGALAGTRPEDAFYVRVGLGATMTVQDVNEGRMNVEVGMAAVRPAEFIVVRFTHIMMKQ